jgi:hypothetical protein
VPISIYVGNPRDVVHAYNSTIITIKGKEHQVPSTNASILLLNPKMG